VTLRRLIYRFNLLGYIYCNHKRAVMKDLVRKVNSFILFESPAQTGHIKTLFVCSQNQYQMEHQGWEVNSTRQQLIARYWFTYVKAHFTAIVGLPLLLLWPLLGISKPGFLIVILVVSLICFLVLLFAEYWPTYYLKFLPMLEAVISSFKAERQKQVIQKLSQQVVAERGQSERLRLEFQRELHEKLERQQAEFLARQETLQSGFAKKMASEKEKTGQQQEGVKKCRQAQLSNFALALIFYALSKAVGKGNIIADDQTAGLLLKLYGVDRGSLRASLALITGGGKIKDIGERKRTELRNRFAEAIGFFEEMGFNDGVNTVSGLEMKICGSRLQ
jgi:uncharacterized coiled-coil protein SlyX